MNIVQGHSDRFGYYTVGDQKIYSKLEAIKLHVKTGNHPEWHYHDEIFSSYNWTQEPTQSLTDLYRKRAEQLREKYDYIVLLYSGGADSNNVLDSFIDNNIHLDEIATWHFHKGNNSKTTFNDAETWHVAFPKVKKILESHPTITQRIIDLTDHVYNYFAVSSNAEEYIYNQSAMVGPDLIRNRIHEADPFYADYILSGKKICFLWAVDKPRVLHENGRYSVRFPDVFDMCVTIGSAAPVEFFYWSPDLPELIIKQAHIVKRYMENSTAASRFITTEPTWLANRRIGDKNLWLTNHGLHSLIYPTWDIETLSVGKTTSAVFSRNGKWFFNLNKSDPSRQHWYDLTNIWWNTLPDYWKNNPASMAKGIKGCLSKHYYLT